VKAARDAWFGRLAGVRLDRLVFLDEFGAATNMQRTHGRAPPGERVVSAVPHGHWKLLSTIAAMTARGVLCSASFDGATDTALFAAFVREALVPLLVPLLAPGQVVVLDNLQPHKSPQVRRLVESAGATLLLLPPYSPDFNPIERAISKVKTVLPKLARRTVDALFAGIGEALASVTTTDALHYINHCGYAR
jgi:transposase